jgi:predicted adenylyl cyclase CyaB
MYSLPKWGLNLAKTTIELKAQITNRDSIRDLLLNNSANYIGRYHQIDTYFKTDRGRLKLRELDGQNRAHLIFLQREDVNGPKESKVWKVEIQDPKSLKELISQVLPINVIIEKDREVYMCNSVQVHLDKVERLGEFLELEKEVQNTPESKGKGREELELLLKKLKVNRQTLQKRAYAELIVDTER